MSRAPARYPERPSTACCPGSVVKPETNTEHDATERRGVPLVASTLTTFDGLMKEKYEDPSIVEKLIYPENPLLAMLEKRGDTGMVGDVLPVPILYGLPQGIAGS